MSYKTGDSYTGEFKDSVFHGNGMFKYSNGDIYRGQFKEGYKHGQGCLTLAKKEGEEGEHGGEYAGDFVLD